MNPLISIVIPNYNTGQFLPECIASCCYQEMRDYEIIVVDDASTDNSTEVMFSLGKKIRKVLKSNNTGVSTTRNEGIISAKGKYIVLLDSDDMLTPDSLQKRLHQFEKHPELDMVHGLAERYYDGRYGGCNLKSKIHDQTVMIKRSVFERYGLFYEKLRSKENKELWYRLGVHPSSPLPKLINAKKINKVVAAYRKHSAQKHRIRKNDPKFNARTEKVFAKRIEELIRDGITRENTRFPDESIY